MAVYPITEPPGRLGVITAYLMIYVVWGSTYYFIGTALQGFPPFLLGGMRFCTAGLLLLLAGRARGEDIFRGPLVRRSAVSGIILLFVDMAVVMLAQQYLSSSLVAIIASSTAIWNPPGRYAPFQQDSFFFLSSSSLSSHLICLILLLSASFNAKMWQIIKR